MWLVTVSLNNHFGRGDLTERTAAFGSAAKASKRRLGWLSQPPPFLHLLPHATSPREGPTSPPLRETPCRLPPPTCNARPAIGTLVSPCAPGGAIRPVIRARAAPRACIFGAAGMAGPGTWPWSGSLICRIRTRAQHPPHPFGGRAHVRFAHFGRMARGGGEGPSPHDVA